VGGPVPDFALERGDLAVMDWADPDLGGDVGGELGEGHCCVGSKSDLSVGRTPIGEQTKAAVLPTSSRQKAFFDVLSGESAARVAQRNSASMVR
jgi:hypothetical protein